MLILVFSAYSVKAEVTTRERLETKYLYNFCDQVTWPDETRLGEFTIAVIGTPTSLMISELRLMAKAQKLKNVPIRINFVNSISKLGGSQALFMLTPDKAKVEDFYRYYDGSPILLISNNFSEKRMVMLNLYMKEKNLHFEMNKANIINQGLKVNSDIILYGGTEIDVAKLYKEGQASLAGLQKQLSAREQKLSTLTDSIQIREFKLRIIEREMLKSKESLESQLKENAIQKAENLKHKNENQRQAKELATLQQSITKSQEKIAKSKEKIAGQEKLLTARMLELKAVHDQKAEVEGEKTVLEGEIVRKSKMVEQQKREIDGKVKEIATKEAEIRAKKREVQEVQQAVDKIRDDIDNSSAELDSKTRELVNLGGIVANQKTVMSLLKLAIGLSVVVVFTIVFAYRNKRNDNRKLLLHGAELEAREVKLNKTLHELKSTQDQLIEAKENAVNANQAKSEFLANMSHEIRTPMNAIIGFSELLSYRESDPQKSHYLDAIQTSGVTLLSLINDILDLSKVEAGKLNLQYGPVNLSNLVSSTEHIFEHQLEEKGLNFFIDLDDNIPESLLLDETRLRQVMINLLGNAVKFTHSGKITVSVHCSALDKASGKLSLTISVADTGIGIPEDQQELIFKAFTQNSRQKVSEYGGTGLGLAITTRLIHMMKGNISVESKNGGGATFTIIMPEVEVATVPAVSARGKELSEISAISFKPAKILIADDIDYNREVLINYLDPWDFTFIEAVNGEEVIDLARSEQPDLVLMDMKMPVMDGYTAVTRLKQDESLKHIPVIAVTATALKEEVDQVSELCDSYLCKPIRRLELVRRISVFLDHEKTPEVEVEPDNAVAPLDCVKLAKLTEHAFVDDLRIINQKLSEAVSKGAISELEELSEEVHSIAQQNNFVPLETWALEFKAAVSQFDIHSYKKKYKQLRNHLQELKNP